MEEFSMNTFQLVGSIMVDKGIQSDVILSFLRVYEKVKENH